MYDVNRKNGKSDECGNNRWFTNITSSGILGYFLTLSHTPRTDECKETVSDTVMQNDQLGYYQILLIGENVHSKNINLQYNFHLSKRTEIVLKV